MAVPGHHHERTVNQNAQTPRNGLGKHRHAPDAPSQVALVDDLWFQFTHQIEDS